MHGAGGLWDNEHDNSTTNPVGRGLLGVELVEDHEVIKHTIFGIGAP